MPFVKYGKRARQVCPLPGPASTHELFGLGTIWKCHICGKRWKLRETTGPYSSGYHWSRVWYLANDRCIL